MATTRKVAAKAAPVNQAVSNEVPTQWDESGAMWIAEKIAVSLLDKNKDGSIKDDLLTMATNFIKDRFAKK